MAKNTTIRVKGKVYQNRLLKSFSSGFSSGSSRFGSKGSKVIPHLGQFPG